jgi:hypothetical protein
MRKPVLSGEVGHCGRQTVCLCTASPPRWSLRDDQWHCPLRRARRDAATGAQRPDRAAGGQTRRLFLTQETADPDVAQVPLSTATTTLREALHDIAKLAKETEKPRPAGAIQRVLDARAAPVWTLALDEIFSSGVELSPRLPFDGPRDFTGPERAPRTLAKTARRSRPS